MAITIAAATLNFAGASPFFLFILFVFQLVEILGHNYYKHVENVDLSNR